MSNESTTGAQNNNKTSVKHYEYTPNVHTNASLTIGGQINGQVNSQPRIIKDVSISQKIKPDDKIIMDNFETICAICQTPIKYNLKKNPIHYHLSKEQHTCIFCTKHQFIKRKQHILVLSFRAIIAYYYQFIYCKNFSNYHHLSLYEIHKIIKNHYKTGIQNPLFYYEQENMLWFIDFSHITTKDAYNITLGHVKKIYNQMRVKTLVGPQVYKEMWEKYRKAIDEFYKTRNRPEDRKLLIPTFYDVISKSNQIYNTRNFRFSSLIPK